MSRIYRYATLSLWVAITSCTTPSPQATPLPSPVSRQGVSPKTQSLSPACPVTAPRRVENVRGGITFDPSYLIGSDQLWTSISADNILLAQPWLYRAQVKGELRVVGQLVGEANGASREVDLAQDINPAEFPELEAGIEGSVSYMVFPSTGCWNVTASKGSEQIQFTTQVVDVE